MHVVCELIMFICINRSKFEQFNMSGKRNCGRPKNGQPTFGLLTNSLNFQVCYILEVFYFIL